MNYSGDKVLKLKLEKAACRLQRARESCAQAENELVEAQSAWDALFDSNFPELLDESLETPRQTPDKST